MNYTLQAMAEWKNRLENSKLTETNETAKTPCTG